MQPQEGGIDWAHVITGALGAVFGVLSTIGTWLYRAGGTGPKLRADIQKSIDEAERRIETKVDDLTGNYNEYFDGIRRQIDDHRLHTETKFVRKEDFRDFREEYREDMRDLKSSVGKILGKHE